MIRIIVAAGYAALVIGESISGSTTRETWTLLVCVGLILMLLGDMRMKIDDMAVKNEQ